MARIGKKELVKEVAKALNISQKETQAVIDKTIEKIVEEVKKGNEVVFLGFGTFKQKVSKEKEGVNPQTKEKIKIPASKTIAFKASSKLKEVLK